MAKKGKYADLVKTLPHWPGVEPERLVVMDEVKRQILAPQTHEERVEDAGKAEIRQALVKASTAVADALQIAKRMAAGKTTVSAFALAYAEVRFIKDKMSSWWSSMNLLLEAYQILMINQMEAEGTTGVDLADGRRVSYTEKPFVSVVDKEALRRWCLSQTESVTAVDQEGNPVLDGDGQPVLEERCIFETLMVLHPSTVQSLTTEMLMNGQPEPPGVSVWNKATPRLGSE